MYIVSRECSPEWEAEHARSEALASRLFNTRGELFGLRANILSRRRDLVTHMYLNDRPGTAESVFRALTEALDWIDMLCGPRFTDYSDDLPEIGADHGPR